MSLYKQALPKAFPWLTQIRGFEIEFFVGSLAGHASFALTMEDAHRDIYNLWMSQHGYGILSQTDCLKGVFVRGTKGE